jgi:hypothetical protein
MTGPDDRDPAANYALLLAAWCRVRSRWPADATWCPESAGTIARIERHIVACRRLVARRRCDGCQRYVHRDHCGIDARFVYDLRPERGVCTLHKEGVDDDDYCADWRARKGTE